MLSLEGNTNEPGRLDQKIVGNLFQPIGGLIIGNCIHQGFRRKVTVDVIDQIGYIQFPRIIWYVFFTINKDLDIKPQQPPSRLVFLRIPTRAPNESKPTIQTRTGFNEFLENNVICMRSDSLFERETQIICVDYYWEHWTKRYFY